MATNFVKCSYREIVDLNTESSKVTAVGIHTPTGDTPRKMFPGLFKQYRKYKYRGCSIAFYPAARLPADPSQVSYGAGEPPIDPRDLMNNILVHGCHGNDMGTILNKLYGDNNAIADSMDRLDMGTNVPFLGSDPWYELMERLYYKALTDRTWKQAGVQRGFRKSGLRPLVYSLATNHQITPSSQFSLGSHLNDNGLPYVPGGVPTSEYSDATVTTTNDSFINDIDNNELQFFTPRLTRLGWMDTRNVMTNAIAVPDPDTSGSDAQDVANILTALTQSDINQINYAELPRIYMLMILLPPAYKTEMYFRAVITHHFAFKGFRGVSMLPEQTGVPSYFGQDADGPVTFPDTDAIDPRAGE